MNNKRSDADQPLAIETWGWKYHHTGIPTAEIKAGERFLEKFGMYISGFETSPFGIEWMRFEPGSCIHPLIQRVPHLAFEVDDLDNELKVHDLEILTPPNSPAEGTRVAMIIHNGAPVELIEFERKIKR